MPCPLHLRQQWMIEAGSQALVPFVVVYGALQECRLCQAQLCFTHTLRFFGAGCAHSLHPSCSLPPCPGAGGGGAGD